jgi:hypothetical protein
VTKSVLGCFKEAFPNPWNFGRYTNILQWWVIVQHISSSILNNRIGFVYSGVAQKIAWWFVTPRIYTVHCGNILAFGSGSNPVSSQTYG